MEVILCIIWYCVPRVDNHINYTSPDGILALHDNGCILLNHKFTQFDDISNTRNNGDSLPNSSQLYTGTDKHQWRN